LLKGGKWQCGPTRIRWLPTEASAACLAVEEKIDGNERCCARALQCVHAEAQRDCAFYEDALEFVNGPRPQFNFPGAWLYSAGHPVLHLNDISQTDKRRPPDLGVIDHVAFSSRGFEAMTPARACSIE
jgi:hypothetical protein